MTAGPGLRQDRHPMLPWIAVIAVILLLAWVGIRAMERDRRESLMRRVWRFRRH
jgi:uncharacterized membrane protein